MTARQDAHQTMWKLGTGAASAAAGLVLLELVFGSWFSADGWERALALNIVRDRRVLFDATPLYDGGGPVVYTRDAYGLRGDYGDPSDIDILTIGGSTTDQRYITDGHTWQDELQRALREDGRDLRVANAGVDGHTTFGHLASFTYWFPLIPNLHPAYVVLHVGLNDFFASSPATYFEGRTDGSATLESRLKADSALYRLYSRAWGTWLARRAGLAHVAVDVETLTYTQAPHLRGHDAIARARFTGFAQRMRSLLQRVRAANARPVCVTQPTLHYRHNAVGTVEGVDLAIETVQEGVVNGVDFFYLRRLQDAIMLSSCRDAGALVVDLAADAWGPEDFYDLVHPTPHGARRMGRRLAEALSPPPF